MILAIQSNRIRDLLAEIYRHYSPPQREVDQAMTSAGCDLDAIGDALETYRDKLAHERGTLQTGG